jgi:hypothetical protein
VSGCVFVFVDQAAEWVTAIELPDTVVRAA